MERERLKGKFMVFQSCGHIGTGEKVPVTNEKQLPLLSPDVQKAIKERKEREQKGENTPPPDPLKRTPLYPPQFYIKPVK